MTKKEALEQMMEIYDEAVTDDGVCYVTSNDKDALEMAIKALKDSVDKEKINAFDIQI